MISEQVTFMPFEWKEEYSVRNPELDRQHMKLLKLCGIAAECLDKGNSDNQMHLLLNDLMDYSREHFITEERLLAACGYPLLDEQKKEHGEYIIQLTELLVSATFGEMRQKELISYVLRWWSEHILVSDKMYIPYISQSR